MPRARGRPRGDPELRVAVSEALKELRQRRGLSVVQLAELIGVSRQSVYDYLSGNMVPDPPKRQILHELGLRYSYRGMEFSKQQQTVYPAPKREEQEHTQLEFDLDLGDKEVHISGKQAVIIELTSDVSGEIQLVVRKNATA